MRFTGVALKPILISKKAWDVENGFIDIAVKHVIYRDGMHIGHQAELDIAQSLPEQPCRRADAMQLSEPFIFEDARCHIALI